MLFRAAPLLGSVVLVITAAAPASAQQSSQSGWTGGPGSSGNNTYTGYVDQPAHGATIPAGSTFPVSGWFVDTTAQGWAGADNMQVWLGQMGGGGSELAQGIVALPRPDVASVTGNPYWVASGFGAGVPSSKIPAGNQTINVYLHTPGKGWWYMPVPIVVSGTSSGGSTTGTAPTTPAPPPSAPAPPPATTGTATGAPVVTVTSPTEGQNVFTNSLFTITGTATTPGIGPSDIDRVDVYINGEAANGTLLGTTTPASDGSWSVGFSPTKFPSTHTNIYVYAHSKSTGKTTETVRGFNITDHK
jgi:hypothetical protein